MWQLIKEVILWCMNVISALHLWDHIDTIYRCIESFEHLPVKLNVKVIKPQFALAPTSVIKDKCKWVTLIVRGCTHCFPVPESYHDSMSNEFIKWLKILRDLQCSPGYVLEVHQGLHARREGGSDFWKHVSSDKMILALFWVISKWNSTFLTLSLVWPFQEE